jgi:arylsulfatase A-like enzyme
MDMPQFSITRRQALSLAGSGSLSGFQPPARPNVLLILADDLGSRDTGFHGSEIRTPNLDRLAAGGVRFTQLYSYPLCSPTRAGLMTGRHPIRYGLAYSVVRPWATYGLSPSETTLANVFKDSGYQTAITGKWHLGHFNRRLLPASRGFDHFYGHVNGAIDYFTHERDGGIDWQRNGQSVREEGYTTDLLAAEANRWIDARDPGRPFFLYMPFNAPHTPLQAPDRWLREYASIKDQRRRTYAAMVSALDAAAGTVIDHLRRKNLLDSTLVVFLSDNGGPRGQGADNGLLRQGKSTVYEGGIRVPGIMHWPSALKPGTTAQVMTPTDWLPTLAAAAGIPAKTAQPLDGANLWPHISGRTTVPRRDLFFCVQGEQGPRQYALRDGNIKFVSIGGAEAIYDVAADPSETTDLLPKMQETGAGMRKRVAEWAALHPRAEVYTGGAQHPGWVPPRDWAKAAVD